MLSKAEILEKIEQNVGNYPAVATRYQVGDPVVRQAVDAIATMVSMFSTQLEVSQSESFEKTRDATVLADAAMRGIVPRSVPARVRVRAENRGKTPVTIETGRNIADNLGIPYRVVTPAVIAPEQVGYFEALQILTDTVTHTVSNSEPFYAVEVQPEKDGYSLCEVSVKDVDGVYVYRNRYINTLAGERVFHIEADDRKRVYVRFGYDGVVGIQPADGAKLTITLGYSAGKITPDFEQPFVFDYILSPADSSVVMTLDSVLFSGQDPISMATLRDLARYPSVYDDSAVFLGEFDLLIRKNFPTLRFLSVWNETVEERARGPSLDNINTLFVACLSETGEETSLDDGNPVAIVDSDLSETQKSIQRVIAAADDSYRVRFMSPVRSKIKMTVSANVSTTHVGSVVETQIREAILAEFGEASTASRRGRLKPLYQRVYELAKARVPALAESGADLIVTIENEPEVMVRPEMWRYVAADTLFVRVTTANIITPSWGGG